jgi:hypothetical protein
MHPDFTAALARERHRQCPCGAVTERPGTLCRKCQARMAWRRRNAPVSCRAARRIARPQAGAGTRLRASLRLAGREAES